MLVADFRDSQTTRNSVTLSVSEGERFTPQGIQNEPERSPSLTFRVNWIATEIATFVESLLTSDRFSTESHG